MRRYITMFLFILAAQIAVVPIAYSQSSCNRILELGFKNIKKKYGERASLFYKYKNYCGKDYRDWKDEQVVDASVDVIGFGGANGSYSRAQAEQTLKTWCNTHTDLEKNSGLDIDESEEINKESVSAWDNCNRLFSQNVLIDTHATEDVVDIRVRYTGPAIPGVQFYEVAALNFKCDTKYPASSGAVPPRRIGPEAISIRCVRAAEHEVKSGSKPENFKKRDRASISVRTAAPEPYTLSFVDEWIPDVPLAESKRLDQLVKKQAAEILALNTRLSTELTATTANLNSLAGTTRERLVSLENTRTNRQNGVFDVGPSGSREARVRVNFPRPFAAVPRVVATVKSHPNDFLVVDVTSIDQNGFDAWVWRVNGVDWGAIQQINWFAFLGD